MYKANAGTDSKLPIVGLSYQCLIDFGLWLGGLSKIAVQTKIKRQLLIPSMCPPEAYKLAFVAIGRTMAISRILCLNKQRVQV